MLQCCLLCAFVGTLAPDYLVQMPSGCIQA
jgi:hypothetical protein